MVKAVTLPTVITRRILSPIFTWDKFHVRKLTEISSTIAFYLFKKLSATQGNKYISAA